MRIIAGNRGGRRRGMSLLETIVYMAIFLVLLGMVTEAFFKCWDSSRAFRRDADDVSRSLQAGEKWRADVRLASGPIERTSADGVETFRIPQGEGEVVYRFAHSELRRRGAPGGKELVVLSDVKASQMESDHKPFGDVCLWELELMAKRQHTLLRPLFTFEAVAPRGKAQ